MNGGDPAGRAWRWQNIPIPEVHVAGTVAAVAIHVVAGWRVFEASIMTLGVGVACILVGLLLATWAVHASGGESIERRSELITDGPFRFSRNPMYVGWDLLYVGIGLVLVSPSFAALLPLILATNHCRDIRREEVELGHRFGDAYARYQSRVRRYL